MQLKGASHSPLGPHGGGFIATSRSASTRVRLSAISVPSLKRRSAFELVTNSQLPSRSMTALAGYTIVSLGGVTPDWFRPHAGPHAQAAASRKCAGTWGRFMPSLRPGRGRVGLSLLLLQRRLSRRPPPDRQPVR